MKLLITLMILIASGSLKASPVFTHCYDYGCKSTQQVAYNNAQWQQIKTLFSNQVVDQSQEKQAIRQAIALMETFSGEIAGTSLDKAGNLHDYSIPNQMDCIDESTNTFQYLNALESFDLLKWHNVKPRQKRLVWFVTHWTAVIAENNSERLFAVDSWYRDNGEPPYIQPIKDWRSKNPFPVLYNPD